LGRDFALASAPVATKKWNRPRHGGHGRGPTPAPRPERNKDELKVAGRNACRALFQKRPQDVRRVYVTDDTMKDFGDVLKWCAANHIAYHKKTALDLDQIAETVHHDGVLFIAREKAVPRVADVVSYAQRQDQALIVLLENVKNPHNVGAILRVCAHFGVKFLLAAGETPSLSPAAMRTAEGGAEHCEVVPCGSGLEICETLRGTGFKIIATSSHTSTSIGDAPLPKKAVVLFGSEGEGLSNKLAAKSDLNVVIPGSGALESLNVACAASVVLWELWRRKS
jgi:RNA methyltransferase, TrmH family